jgi:GNAT superfamily N-acetyltransferase
MFIQTLQYDQTIIYSLVYDTISLSQFKKDHMNIIAYIEVILYENTLQICSLYTKEQHRKRGYAIRLISHVIKHHNDLDCIQLDDMTDKYRQCDNIYLKCGFKYEDKVNGPEMIYTCETCTPSIIEACIANK